MADIAATLRQRFVYDARHSEYFGVAAQGRSTIELSGHRFGGFAQNHDQVGNRAKGEQAPLRRLMQLSEGWLTCVKTVYARLYVLDG